MSTGFSKGIIATATGASGTSVTLKNVAAGDLVVLVIGTAAATTVTSISDGVNTWTAATDAVAVSTKRVEYWQTRNVSATASLVITVTLSGADTQGIIARSYSAVNTTVDGHTTATGSGSSLTTANVTTTASASSLVIGWGGQTAVTAGLTVGAGFSAMTNLTVSGTFNIGAEDKLVASPTSTAMVMGGDGTSWGCGVATYSFAGIRQLNNAGLRPHPFSPGIAR
jgi:hypothetical protein